MKASWFTKRTEPARGPATPREAETALECSRERRQWVRFILPDIVTRVSWSRGEQLVSHLAHMVNVNAGWVVLQMDVEPPADGAIAVHFDHVEGASGPIPARIASMERTGSGKLLFRAEFESEERTRELLFHRRERRSWRRARPLRRRVRLSWEEEGQALVIHGELENISGGGAAVCMPAVPRAGAAVWLSIHAEGVEPVAECRLIEGAILPSGLYLARLAFVDLCPFPVYAAAMGLGE